MKAAVSLVVVLEKAELLTAHLSQMSPSIFGDKTLTEGARFTHRHGHTQALQVQR